MDIGCGEGFFTIPAARIVGKKGKVYGLDRDDEAVSILRQKTSKAGLVNINLRVGEAEETILCDKCADIIFYGIVLHDFYNPIRVLKNAKGMLKPSGLLVNLDWKMKDGHTKKVTENRKARHDYFIEDTYEAGMILLGTEVKSLRLGRANLKDAYARITNGEVFVHQVHIGAFPYSLLIS